LTPNLDEPEMPLGFSGEIQREAAKAAGVPWQWADRPLPEHARPPKQDSTNSYLLITAKEPTGFSLPH